MPCYADSYDCSEKIMQDMKKDIDKLTDMLCRVLTEIGKMHFKECGAMTNLLEDDIKEWWVKHQEWDKKRKESEK